MKRLLILSSLFLAPALFAESFDITPSTIVSGQPNTYVGWGYSINNDTSFYLVVNGATASGFDALSGMFADFIATINFTVVNPNSTQAQTYDHSLQTGLGEFFIFPSATPNVTGATFLVTYDLLVNDPTGPLGGNPGDQFGLSFNSIDRSVNVEPTPEPSTWAMFAIGLTSLAATRRRFARSNSSQL